MASTPEHPMEGFTRERQTEGTSGLRTRTVALSFMIGIAFASPDVLAQDAQKILPASPAPMKTIGAPAGAPKPEVVPSLFVLNPRGATLQGDTLTLTGVTLSSIIFADRPVRSAGHQPTADIIAEWGSGDDSFVKNPPNATVSVFSKDGSVKDAVVQRFR
jgi:hypothetical protein